MCVCVYVCVCVCVSVILTSPVLPFSHKVCLGVTGNFSSRKSIVGGLTNSNVWNRVVKVTVLKSYCSSDILILERKKRTSTL